MERELATTLRGLTRPFQLRVLEGSLLDPLPAPGDGCVGEAADVERVDQYRGKPTGLSPPAVP